MLRPFIDYILDCTTSLKKRSLVMIKTKSLLHCCFVHIYKINHYLKIFAVYLLFSLTFFITSKYHISSFFALKILSLFQKSKQAMFLRYLISIFCGYNKWHVIFRHKFINNVNYFKLNFERNLTPSDNVFLTSVFITKKIILFFRIFLIFFGRKVLI